MKTFDPTKPITLENWPAGLKMPPRKTALEKTSMKPITPKASEEASVPAPWWSAD